MDVDNEYYVEISENFSGYTPVVGDYRPTIIIMLLVSLIGYLIFRLVPLNKLSPIKIVVCLSAMYIFVLISVFWMIQLSPTFHSHRNMMFLDGGILAIYTFPFNCFILLVTTIKRIIYQWDKKNYEKSSLNKLEHFLINSKNFPLFAFLFLIPLLGMIILILTLFGQAPDSIVKAWTETAEWTFSQKVPPPRLDYDGHYLCTVAANGHKKIVKPLSVGNRFGQKIIINRQLCIANAFEEILEEKTPKIHRKIRSFYNKYGYSLSKHITLNFLSDFMYIVMKPLEWLFLFVIYVVDVKPENRICRQYSNWKKV